MKITMIEATKTARVTITSITRWINEGKILATKNEKHNVWEIDKKSMLDFLNKRRVRNMPNLSEKNFTLSVLEDLKINNQIFSDQFEEQREQLKALREINNSLIKQNFQLQNELIEVSKKIISLIDKRPINTIKNII